MNKRKIMIIAIAACIVFAAAAASPAAAQGIGWFTARISVDTEAPPPVIKNDAPENAVEQPITVNEMEIDDVEFQNELHIYAHQGDYEKANEMLAMLGAWEKSP